MANDSGLPTWVWLFTLAIVCLFSGGLFYLSQLDDQPPRPQTAGETEDYGFYKILKETEVPVYEVESYQSTPKDAEEAQRYLLQVGSFRNATDADQLRAQLLLENLNARVQQVQLADQQTWYRVVVGPFNNRSKLNKAQDKLAANNIQSLKIRVNP